MTHSYAPEHTPPQRRWTQCNRYFRSRGWEVQVIRAVALARDYRHQTMVGHGVELRKPMGLAQWLQVPVAFMVRWLWISMMRILASFPSVRLAG